MAVDDTITFEPSLADGTRRPAGTVGVDSGTMALADSRHFPGDEWYDRVRVSGHTYLGHDWACTSSGYGDGGYEVELVVDAGGAVRGVEVVFFSDAVEAPAAKAPAAELGAGPDDDTLAAYCRHQLDDEAAAEIRRYHEAEQAVWEKVWEQTIPGLHPATDSTARPLGEIGVAGRVAVGDPCYEGPSKVLDVPAGRYQVVAWMTDGGSWGTRVARLGAYLTGPAQPSS